MRISFVTMFILVACLIDGANAFAKNRYLPRVTAQLQATAAASCKIDGTWRLRFQRAPNKCSRALEKNHTVIRLQKGSANYYQEGTTFDVVRASSDGSTCVYELRESIWNAVTGTGWGEEYRYRLRQRKDQAIVVGEGDYKSDLNEECVIAFL